MAPNVPQRDTWPGSEETSKEDLEVVVSPVPEVFLSHLPQHFQDPDSPNLYIFQRHDTSRSTPKPTVRSQTTRSTLRAFRPTSAATAHDQEDSALQPSRVTALEDVIHADRSNADNTRLRPQQNGDTLEHSTVAFPASAVPHRGGPRHRVPDTLVAPPITNHRIATPASTEQRFKDMRGEVEGGAVSTRSRSERRSMVTTRRPISSTVSTRRLDPGVLKLPGHEPEAPADLVLIHHDRAIDTRNQTGLNGIYVRDDTTDITPEAATALILVGICIVFFVFICFILFVQKIRRQKLERKVEQSDDIVKPQHTGYEATTSAMHHHHHPNPLSLLPPALLHALAVATANRTDDPMLPSFLTMEPPKSGSNSLGRLWFCVYYDYVQSNLVLRVLHARYTKGRGSSTNPGEVWVEACVLTSMNTVKASTKTSNRRASSAPVFNQTFRFEVDDDEVTQYLLRLTMYDRHPQNGEKAVGAVIVPLSTVDLCSDATLSRDLQ